MDNRNAPPLHRRPTNTETGNIHIPTLIQIRYLSTFVDEDNARVRRIAAIIG
jgi:hypothetical protein